MLQYAVDDVHYLLPLAAKLEEELERVHRRDWFRQSCERAIELAAAERERDQDELWRIGGAGALDPHAGAVLRALWQWRESRSGTGRSTAISYFTEPRALERGGKFHFGSRAGLQTLFRSTAADVPRSSKNCVAIAAIGVAGYAPPRRFSADRRNASARRSVARTARQSGRATWSWSDLSLHRAALSRLLQLILRGQRPCCVPWQRELIGSGRVRLRSGINGYRVYYGITNV